MLIDRLRSGPLGVGAAICEEDENTGSGTAVAVFEGDIFSLRSRHRPLPQSDWLLRVRTRFVQKCTLSARAEAARADEVIERLPGHPGDLGDRALRDPEPEESADLLLFAVEA